ncbi:transposase [Novipirellula sp. SH528]|uniref:transposase n=1 Tax=Novipirellula sp. SH528 TaxID=3454466 RepID=UPI003FA06CC5
MKQIDEYRRQLEQRRKPDEFVDHEWEHHKQKLLFAFVDHLLDHEPLVTHLADDQQAKIVANAFLNFADERYRLFGFVVMPSHHHWLFIIDEEWSDAEVIRLRSLGKSDRTPREIVSHSIQSYTATMCNRVRGIDETYWQQETFDHWVRDESETLKIIRYIECNPVKAGLVGCPEAYRWSSARLRSENNIPVGHPIPKQVLS